MSCLKPEGREPVATKGAPDFNAYDVMQPRAPGATPKELKNGGRVKASEQAPQGVYLPNNNILTPQMRSPDYVQMSTAAAMTLGIMPGKMHRCACTRCLNLLLTYPEGCRANCAYCGLARHREADRDYADRNFIRVDWPAVPMAQIVDIVAQGRRQQPVPPHVHLDDHPSQFGRGHGERAQGLDGEDRSVGDPDLDPLQPDHDAARATSSNLRDLGADIFTVALDAATPELFDRTRGKGVASPHSWKKYWEILRRRARHLRAAEIRRPYHRRHGRDRARRAAAWCSSWSIWAATATCSASSRSRAR